MDDGEQTNTSDDTPRTEQPRIISLAADERPRDLGLTSLALMMQLYSSAAIVFWTLIVILISMLGALAILVVFIAITFLIRAALHRGAANAMLYGSTPPRRAVQTYVGVALVQSIGMLVMLHRLDLGLSEMLQWAGMLMAWPITLGTMLYLPRFRGHFDKAIRPDADLGYEGASVLMVLFGVAGVSVPLVALWMLLDTSGISAISGKSIIFVAVLLLLLARSVSQILAGRRGADTRHGEASVERYVSLGIATSFIAGIAVATIAFIVGGLGWGLLFGCALSALLFIWPMTLRRYYQERSFELQLAAASQGPQEPWRRAPDKGITALGWFLMVTAIVNLATLVPQALFGGADFIETVSEINAIFGAETAALVRSFWWNVGVEGLQLWAGIEIIRMSRNRRMAANIYAGVAIVIAAYVLWPLVSSADPFFARIGGSSGYTSRVILVLTVAFKVLVPLATLVIMRRDAAPKSATARVKSRPSQPSEDAV